MEGFIGNARKAQACQVCDALILHNALLRRGGRRFFNKRLRDARSGEDDEVLEI
ncbi:unnamed protein product [Effrenium voratum]|uniref:Uncharacterized protein n=1 Tax=Effrenium voratum TaxID=2562239 RepID=A0AA36IK17_9DINO|nr:unnamed protein product [Effrenium voratum]